MTTNAFWKGPWAKLLLGMAGVGGVFLALRYFHVDFSHVTAESFKKQIDAFGVWGPVIYIILYVLRPLILFPAAVFSASAGAIWGLKGLGYLLIGANLSAIAEFIFARYFARQAVERWIQDKFSGLDRQIERRGFLTVLLIRLIPNVAWDIQNLALGVTKVRFSDYVLATVIGILPGSFALVYFGSSFISVITDPRNFWKLIIAAGLFAGVYYLQAAIRKRRAALLDK